ncbi:MAG: hypothetical protein E7812_06180 [Phenylobacterium sp.]|nr:MAG: hypothetical protein E7812_06180 [Phenylobacterium sp.]
MRTPGKSLPRALGLALMACGALAAAPQRAPVNVRPVGQIVAWDAARDGKAATYRIGPYQLSLSALRDPDDTGPTPELTVSRADRSDVSYIGLDRGVTLAGVAGFPTARATFTVMRLDPAAAEPAIVLTTYSGGAHCCTDIQIANPTRNSWIVTRLGQLDVDPFYQAPRDFDGDGALELVIPDDRFDYQFDAFAGSWQPVRVFGVRHGVAVDRSAEPGFRKVLADDMQKAGAACRKGQSGACPAFIADAARIGRFAEAWAVMLRSVRPDFEFPRTRCGAHVLVLQCPKREAQPVSDYPTAVRLALVEAGYPVPRSPAKR